MPLWTPARPKLAAYGFARAAEYRLVCPLPRLAGADDATGQTALQFDAAAARKRRLAGIDLSVFRVENFAGPLVLTDLFSTIHNDGADSGLSCLIFNAHDLRAQAAAAFIELDPGARGGALPDT